MNRVDAPWTEQQVASLTAFQADGRFHPFTCPGAFGTCGQKDDRNLRPTIDGWVCACGSYRQPWAWSFMLTYDPQTADFAGDALLDTAIDEVSTLIDSVKAAGLTEAGEMFERVYWAWLRSISAYRHAAPYVEKPDEEQHSPYAALHVFEYTVRFWGAQIPGTPGIDNKAVRAEGEADDAWHREEDRRMRRTAGRTSDG